MAVVAAWSDYFDLLDFPVHWRTGVHTGLSMVNELLIGGMDELVGTVIVAAVAGLILVNRVNAVAARGQPSYNRAVQVVKPLLVLAVAGVLVLHTGLLLWQWQIPEWLPDPITLWLTI